MMTVIYTVSQVTAYIKGLFTQNPRLSSITVAGEISNVSDRGHIYFTLKDRESQISCVMFAGNRAGLSFRLQEGQSVKVTGNISVYERDGKYQLYAYRIDQEGSGDLHEQLEQLKLKLQAEGLFADSHKKPLPKYISTLGIITANHSAALSDIEKTVRSRNPYIRRILYPAKVQGEGAALSLIAGLKKMEEIRPDVIIIGRGGGSFEDLNEFNNEALARAIYDCSIPVISAVGHEKDYSICDLAADKRAATPTAAAQMAVYEYDELYSDLIDRHSDLCAAMTSRLELNRQAVAKYRLALNALSPASRIKGYQSRQEAYRDKLRSQMASGLDRSRHKLCIYVEQLKGLSPLDKLAQGYSYVTDEKGHNIKSIKAVSKGSLLNIRMTDGQITARAEDIRPSGED